MQRSRVPRKASRKAKPVHAPKIARVHTAAAIRTKTVNKVQSSPYTLSKRSMALPAGGITAAMVKSLRDGTGAPMIECKKALTAIFESDDYDTSNDKAVMASASEYLRKRGTALASKQAGRTAAEGAVAVVITPDRRSGIVLETNCETDFVARNGTFLTYATRSALTLLKNKDTIPMEQATGGLQGTALKFTPDHLSAQKIIEGPCAMPSNPDAANNTLATELIDVITTCRENIKLRRASVLQIPENKKGFVSGYVHNQLPISDDFKAYHDLLTQQGYTVSLGVIGAAGAFVLPNNDDEPTQASIDLGNKVMMHTVAASPEYLVRENVPQALVDKEREILLASTPTEGKPAHIVEKLMEGKLNKFYQGVVLLEQEFLVTNDTKKPTITQLLKGTEQQPELVAVAHYMRGAEVEGEDAPAPAPSQ